MYFYLFFVINYFIIIDLILIFILFYKVNYY